MSKLNELFVEPYKLNATYPGFISLNQIKPFATEVANELWGSVSISKLDDEAEQAELDLRTGFIGTVVVHEAKLIYDGAITEPRTDNPITLDGPLFRLDMRFLATGEQPIEVLGGLAIGFGYEKLEVRSYDLEKERFGKISCFALDTYLKSSQLKGGGTGESRVKAVGISRRSSAQVRRNK